MRRFLNRFILIVLASGLPFIACKESPRCSERSMILEAIRDNISNEPPGRTLMLRVFCNGEAEYDMYGNGVPPETKQTILSDEELSKIKDATHELTLEPHSSNYDPTTRSVDSFITVTLTYDGGDGRQTVVMKEADSHIHIDALASPALRKVMWLVTNININRRLGKSQN